MPSFDRTMCGYKNCAKFSTCDRALTKEVKKYARENGITRFWKYLDMPKCFKESK